MLPQLLSLKTFTDPRGSLSFAEVGAGLPFSPQRCFLIHDVPVGITRGGHAHRRCDQLLVAIHGSVQVTLDDGRERIDYLLGRPDQALRIPAGIWGEQRYLSEGACLLVLASHPYDADDYLQDYSEFLAFRKGQP